MIANLKVDRSHNDESQRHFCRNGMYFYKATYTIPTLFDEIEYTYTTTTDEDVTDDYIKIQIIKSINKRLFNGIE